MAGKNSIPTTLLYTALQSEFFMKSVDYHNAGKDAYQSLLHILIDRTQSIYNKITFPFCKLNGNIVAKYHTTTAPPLKLKRITASKLIQAGQ